MKYKLKHLSLFEKKHLKKLIFNKNLLFSIIFTIFMLFFFDDIDKSFHRRVDIIKTLLTYASLSIGFSIITLTIILGAADRIINGVRKFISKNGPIIKIDFVYSVFELAILSVFANISFFIFNILILLNTNMDTMILEGIDYNIKFIFLIFYMIIMVYTASILPSLILKIASIAKIFILNAIYDEPLHNHDKSNK